MRFLKALVRWVHCEPSAINTKKHSLAKWLVFHGQVW